MKFFLFSFIDLQELEFLLSVHFMTIGINYYVNRTQMIKLVLGISIIPFYV